MLPPVSQPRPLVVLPLRRAGLVPAVIALSLAALLLGAPLRADINACDRVASHPSDPDKVLPGFGRSEIDLPKAESICRAELQREPNDARTTFHVGRVLYYQGKAKEALPFLEKSADMGYRQAIFVLGFVLYDASLLPRDDCRAASLWQKSLALEHPWTGAFLVDAYLDGRFDKCGVRLSDEQMKRYVALSTANIPYGESEGRMERVTQRLAARARAAAAAATPAGAAISPFDPSKYSQVPTECDRMASHPEDPNRVSEGRERPEIDLPKAIEICRAAVAADPRNPRLNYLLGRVLGYSGRGSEALANRQAAVDADYPQALFVIGYITVFGFNQQPKDVCKGAELIRRSAFQGRMAGQLGFPSYVVAGLFDACPVRKDATEMLGFIDAAKKQMKGDYYQQLLAERLEAELRRR
jgi:tetratricopeptide (TPR) repeat protein